jgi:hypothetical protein
VVWRLLRWFDMRQLAALVALACGCIATEPADEIDEVESAVTATGCDAIVVSWEGHDGFYNSATDDLSITKLEYKLKNPSSVDCESISLRMAIFDMFTFVDVKRSTTLTTSLKAGYSRRVWWSYPWSTNSNAENYWGMLYKGTGKDWYGALKRTQMTPYFVAHGLSDQ